MQSIFLFPIALAGLALLALPVIVHLLNRRKADQLYFPSLRFITASRTTMLRVHQVKNIPLLLLRLLIFALIVFAAARPFRIPFGSATENQQTVILIDTSASMNAKGRWAEAIQQARSTIEKQPDSSRVALLAFDSTGRVVADLNSRSESAAALDKAIASGLKPSGESMKWERCRRFLKEFLKSNSSGVVTVFVISDFQASNFKLDQSTLVDGAKIEAIDVHGFDHNLFLQNLSLQQQGDKLKLAATVIDETKSEQGTESKFNTAVFDVPPSIENKPFEALDPKTGVTLKLLPGPAVDLTGTMTGGWTDELESDNTIYFVLRRPSPFTVEVLRGTNSSEQLIEGRKYLSAALASLPAELIDKVIDTNLAGTGKQEDRRIVVADFKQLVDPESQKSLSDFVRNGGRLWLISPDPSDAEFINSRISASGDLNPITSLQREDSHQVFLSDDLDPSLGRQIGESVRKTLTTTMINREIKFAAGPQSSVLLRYSDGVPALISRTVGRGEILVWGLPLLRKSSLLVTDISFPLLCQGLLKRSNDDPSFEIDTERDATRFGSWIRSLGTIKGIETLAGGGNTPATPGSLSLWQPGLYTFRAESADAVVAINQSAEESHPGSVSEAQNNELFKTQNANPERPLIIREKEESAVSLWRYILTGVLILLVVELVFSFYRREREDYDYGTQPEL